MIDFDMYHHVPPSGTLLLNEQSAALARTGQDVYRFGFGQSPFPVCSILVEALKNNAHRKEYTEVQGLLELRHKIAKFHSDFEKRIITEDQIMVAPGSKALLFTIMRAYEDACVLIPAPAWVSYAPQTSLIGHTPILMHTDYEKRYRITPDILENHLLEASKTRKSLLVVLNSPGNPDGLSYKADELKILAEILKRYNAKVISDEIYGPLHHNGQHVSIAQFYPEGTFVTTGLSKWAGAGGWRLGATILPENYDPELKQALLGIASETYSCAPAPVQHAAIAAYDYGIEMQDYLARERIILKNIAQSIHKKAIDIDLRAHPAEGGFYILIDFSYYKEALEKKRLTTDRDVCAAILKETGAAFLPGSAFGMDETMLAARLAYVDFDGAAALSEAGSWSDALTDKYAEKMCIGLDKVGKFLKG